MLHYLFQAAYTPQAWAALARNPQDRIEAVRPVVERLGGKIVAGFLSFGEYDVVALLEMPDNESVAASSIAASTGGAVKAIKTNAPDDDDGSHGRDDEGCGSGIQAT